jgi:hypothetical protein
MNRESIPAGKEHCLMQKPNDTTQIYNNLNIPTFFDASLVFWYAAVVQGDGNLCMVTI